MVLGGQITSFDRKEIVTAATSGIRIEVATANSGHTIVRKLLFQAVCG
jgi:hypothetical protein